MSRSVATDIVDKDTIKSLLPQLASVATVAMAARQGGAGGGFGSTLIELLGGSVRG